MSKHDVINCEDTVSWDVAGLPVTPDNMKYEVRQGQAKLENATVARHSI